MHMVGLIVDSTPGNPRSSNILLKLLQQLVLLLQLVKLSLQVCGQPHHGETYLLPESFQWAHGLCICCIWGAARLSGSRSAAAAACPKGAC